MTWCSSDPPSAKRDRKWRDCGADIVSENTERTKTMSKKMQCISIIEGCRQDNRARWNNVKVARSLGSPSAAAFCQTNLTSACQEVSREHGASWWICHVVNHSPKTSSVTQGRGRTGDGLQVCRCAFVYLLVCVSSTWISSILMHGGQRPVWWRWRSPITVVRPSVSDGCRWLTLSWELWSGSLGL